MGNTIGKLFGMDAGAAERQAAQQAAAIKASSDAQAASALESARSAALSQENSAARAKAEGVAKDAAASQNQKEVEVDVAKKPTPIARKRQQYQSSSTPGGTSIRI